MRWLRKLVYRYVKYLPLINRWIRWQDLVYSCETKVQYPRENSALRAMAEMNAKRSTRNELEHYRCRFCNGWHLGRKRAIRLVAKSSARHAEDREFESHIAHRWT